MIHVVYACDDAYVRPTLISMASVWKHNPHARIDLVTDHISEENRRIIQKVSEQYGESVICYELQDVLPELYLDRSDRHPHTIYAKLFMDAVIHEDRILYLDSDVIVRDSLEPLFERDMSQEYVAGVLMPYSPKLKERIKAFPGEPYICDGVVLLHLARWREKNLSEACLGYIRDYQGQPPMLSEGTMNHICRGQIGVLEPKYNLMPSMIEYSHEEIVKLFRADCYYKEAAHFREAKETPVIIHFMNELYDRPWCEGCTHPFKEAYLQTEKEIYGENRLEAPSLSAHTKRTLALRRQLPFGIFSTLYHIRNKV